MIGLYVSKIPWFKCFPSDFLNGVSTLSPHEGWVYAIILMRIYDEDGPIPDKPEQIARRCNMRLYQCKKAIDTLVDEGKLIRENGYLANDRANKVLVERHELAKKSSRAAAARWEKAKKKPNKINGTPMQAQCERNADAMPVRSQKPEARSQKDINSDFEDWYQHYPRKVGRGQAERAFKKALNETDLQTLIATTRSYAEQCIGKDAQFIKHPSTWLNGKCWLDEDTDSYEVLWAEVQRDLESRE